MNNIAKLLGLESSADSHSYYFNYQLVGGKIVIERLRQLRDELCQQYQNTSSARRQRALEKQYQEMRIAAYVMTDWHRFDEYHKNVNSNKRSRRLSSVVFGFGVVTTLAIIIPLLVLNPTLTASAIALLKNIVGFSVQLSVASGAKAIWDTVRFKKLHHLFGMNKYSKIPSKYRRQSLTLGVISVSLITSGAGSLMITLFPCIVAGSLAGIVFPAAATAIVVISIGLVLSLATMVIAYRNRQQHLHQLTHSILPNSKYPVLRESLADQPKLLNHVAAEPVQLIASANISVDQRSPSVQGKIDYCIYKKQRYIKQLNDIFSQKSRGQKFKRRLGITTVEEKLLLNKIKLENKRIKQYRNRLAISWIPNLLVGHLIEDLFNAQKRLSGPLASRTTTLKRKIKVAAQRLMYADMEKSDLEGAYSGTSLQQAAKDITRFTTTHKANLPEDHGNRLLAISHAFNRASEYKIKMMYAHYLQQAGFCKPRQYQDYIKNICYQIGQDILQLDIDERYIVSSGYTGTGGSHAILFEVRKLGDNNFQISPINTGAGCYDVPNVQHQDQGLLGWLGTHFLNALDPSHSVVITNIRVDQVSDPEYVMNMFAGQFDPGQDKDESKKAMINGIKNLVPKGGEVKRGQRYVLQTKGTCTYSCLQAWLSTALPEDLFLVLDKYLYEKSYEKLSALMNSNDDAVRGVLNGFSHEGILNKLLYSEAAKENREVHTQGVRRKVQALREKRNALQSALDDLQQRRETTSQKVDGNGLKKKLNDLWGAEERAWRAYVGQHDGVNYYDDREQAAPSAVNRALFSYPFWDAYKATMNRIVELQDQLDNCSGAKIELEKISKDLRHKDSEVKETDNELAFYGKWAL